MPLFISDDEFRLIANDASAVAERADAFIRDFRRQLDTVRAEADAASIAAEQTCALIEQKYSSLYSEFSRLQSENAQLSASVELRLSEIAEAQAEKHKFHLKAIGKDGEIERLSVESAELLKSKRQLLELVELKDAEIREKNATIQSYLDKIVNLSESNTMKESRIHETEIELGRCQAAYNRITQEKELLEKHNAWLNEELTAKVNSLVELRRTHMNVEADVSSKLADHERQISESSNSLKWNKERVYELNLRVNSLEEELRTSKEAGAANEGRFASELMTVTKLVELYKASSEEWSKKAGELEGVIKALETQLNQSENDYKEKLDREESARKDLEKEAAALREKLEKCETEIENTRKANELSFLPLSSFRADLNAEKLSIVESDNSLTNEIGGMIVPRVPMGISGTALAASLLRDGWSLAKMYEKYQEANDAFLHERLERQNAEMTLKRVFHEIERKVGMILDERAEHERMVEAYALMDQKLQDALSEHDNLDNTIRQLKAEVKVCQRDYTIAQKEIIDLQKQVTTLLKECQDVQLRCGGIAQVSAISSPAENAADPFFATDAESIISEHLLAFKDINGLVEQNVRLRRLVHNFSIQEEKRDAEIREGVQIQLQKVTDGAAAKVEAVLKRSEEQASMIESLHSSVAMYKRLYEEERNTRISSNTFTGVASEDGKKDLMVLSEGSQEVSKKSHEQLYEHARNLEQELAALRSELSSLRLERDKMSLEANFARERLDSFMKEFDHQRQEANAVSARNVELTHLIVDYQRRLRECSDSLQTSEENSRKLSMEVSILKHEMEILKNSEKRASDEVQSLSERVYRLQSSLDTVQSAEEVRENARAMERRKHEEYVKQVEMEWAEAKKELQEERDRVRTLTFDKQKVVENSMMQVEEMRKELADAWRAIASAESRAAVAEARCSDLEAKINPTEIQKITKTDGGREHSVLSTNEVDGELWKAKDELEKLKEEAQANKEYARQYKEIARTNEIVLKQIESAHEEYKLDAEKVKKTLEDEVQFLHEKVREVESNYRLKSDEFVLATESKEQALSAAMAETLSLREKIAERSSQIEVLEMQVSSLKDDVDKEHTRWRTAQDNYERQIMQQSETIQELMNTSKELSMLQSEITKLRELSEVQKTANDLLKKSCESKEAELLQLKSEAERKYNEVNEQNKILHNRLEALHIKLADKEQGSSVFSSQSTDSQADDDFHNVISYLRRSKEIAETEISLLKQEKLRLQSQLEVALKASENAQAFLRSQRENSREQLFKDDEFKALQLQVREINLLRESNVQLRAENKHNFEESQKFREEAQKIKTEAENLGSLLRTKEVELYACQKEVEVLKLEIGHLNSKITESSTKIVDIEEYERMKNELESTKILLRESISEVDLTKNLISATEHGCLVVNAPTANTVAAAEHAIALMAAMARNVAQADAALKKGKWERNKYVGVSLVGKTLAVMGFGKVGSEVARRAKGLGMHVIAHDPYAAADRARALGVELVAFDEAIASADFISLHMPLTPSTSKILNDEAFAKMKKGVRIVNVARGGVIDEEALVRALDSGIVAQAALDVFTKEPPPADDKMVLHENVTVTPHLGASTTEAQEGVAIEIAEAVVGALKGELASTAVNAPMVPAEVLAELAPYVVLAEKLGRLAVQLVAGGSGMKSVKVTYASARTPDDLDTRVLRAMITKGLIEPVSSTFVNLVNADFTAKQRGIRLTEERVLLDGSPESPLEFIQVQIANVESKFASAMSETGEISVEGRVKDGIPHLTKVGSFQVDVSMEGSLILCRQVDQPGMIGTVGSILGEENVNVSFMSVGRIAPRKQAVMAIGVDEEPCEETLKRIGEIPAIEEFVFLKL